MFFAFEQQSYTTSFKRKDRAIILRDDVYRLGVIYVNSHPN